MSRIVIFLICLLSFSTAFAQNTEEFKLPNGLKVIVKQDHRAPIVISKICYKVGSSYEPGGITGVSHALEHMMFKGTAKYPTGQFSKLIAENGGQENAYTSRDFTCYYQKLAADKLPLSLKLEADRMKNLTLSPKEFAKEIQVVMEERRMRTDDNPQSLTYERFNAAAHIVNPYHHMTIGWMNDLKNMSIGDLRAWYDKWYAPNNAVLIVVGDVKPREVLKLANQYFGPLKRIEVPALKPQQAETPLGERNLTVKATAQIPWFIMGYNTPSVPVLKDSSDPYALEVLAAILDGGDSARLSKELVRNKQIASSIGVSYDLYSRFAGLLTFSATPAPKHTVADVKEAILNEINKLKTKPVTTDELNRVKTQVIAQNVYARDSLFYQAMIIGSLETVGMPWNTMDEFVKHIQAVTPAQIQEVAKKYLVSDHLTTAELQPLPPTSRGNHAQ